TWTSSNPALATVDANGLVTAISVGNATITATSANGLTATCKVSVVATPAASISLNKTTASLKATETVQLSATVLPQTTTDKSVTWSSSNPAVATVDANGLVTAISVGNATITATSANGLTATCAVSVVETLPTSIELNIKDMALYVGQSETIQAIVRPASTTYPTVVWSSADNSIATVSPLGKVTGVKEGVVAITATCGNVSATCIVTVNPVPAASIDIITGDVTLTIGKTAKLVAKVLPENTTHPEVEWSSSDPEIATITSDGILTAVSLGTAVIRAKCGVVVATCLATVIPVPSEGIIISPNSVAMLLGDTTTLTATVYPENATDKTIKWTSDDPSVASVSATGVVTALKIGSTTITASNGSAKATCSIKVNPIEATSISLNVMDETIFVASSTQLLATVSPANVTDKTITWTSSKPEIATVTDQGLVYGVAVGSTTVTASIGNVSAMCQINVLHRIPDMDPSVTTSERDIFTLAEQPVNMAVYAQGGEPNGWSFVWTKDGQPMGTGSQLNIVAKNSSKTVVADIYRVKVENEIDKVVIFSETFDFLVHTYP
ncbi:MAG: Ig-like domain-containing protein, partial [Muribaculaceae bacterium]|nr:Ig-like domain-containing protein [Muribaculaceae bacterium]